MLDCAQTRAEWQLLTAAADGLSAEATAVRQHLEHCPACRAAWAAEKSYDQKLAMRMQSVAVPPQLSSTLLRQVTAQRSKVRTPTNRWRRRQHTWTTACAAALILIASISWMRWVVAPASIHVADFVVRTEGHSIPPDALAASVSDRPAGWTSAFGLTEQRSGRVSVEGVPVTAVSFAFRPSRSAAASSGVLWIAETSRIQQSEHLPLPSLDNAEIQYNSHGARLLWSEGSFVFLLEIRGDATALRVLHDRLKKSRSLA